MYLCPRCDKQYDKVPEACVQCKRPLILNKRYRIEMPVQSGITGEDFDVLDLKRDEPAIMRELRVRKDDAGKRKAEIDRYNANRTRLGGMKYDGNKVLIDAFKQEFKNSVCYYFVFDADAWASLGDELDGPSGGGGGGAAVEEELPPVEGRDLDPEMAAMLASLEARSGGGDDEKKSAKKKSAPADDGDGAMVKADDASPAKKESGGGGMAKVVVSVSVVVLIIVAVVALLLL